MAKGTVVPQRVKDLLRKIYFKHPKWKAERIHVELLEHVQREISWAEPGWPGLSSVRKELTKIKDLDAKRPLELQELEKPWSVVTLGKYPIPPEVLPMLIRVWGNELADRPLTIREALWLARLHRVFLEANIVNEETEPLFVETARDYAASERALEMNPNWGEEPQDLLWQWSDDVFLHHLMTDDEELYDKWHKSSGEWRSIRSNKELINWLKKGAWE